MDGGGSQAEAEFPLCRLGLWHLVLKYWLEPLPIDSLPPISFLSIGLSKISSREKVWEPCPWRPVEAPMRPSASDPWRAAARGLGSLPLTCVTVPSGHDRLHKHRLLLISAYVPTDSEFSGIWVNELFMISTFTSRWCVANYVWLYLGWSRLRLCEYKNTI